MTHPEMHQALSDAKTYMLKAAEALKAAGREDLEENVSQIVRLIETPDSEQVIVQNLHI